MSRSHPSIKTGPAFSKPSRAANSLERLRFLLDALTNPVQLPILNQTKLEQASAPPSSILPTQTSAPSILSSSSSLLRSQARLKAVYVDWEDGVEQVKGYVREGGPEAAKRLFGLLIERMRVKNSESRLLCVYLIDELFNRSAHFRHLTLQWLHTFFELTLGVSTATSAGTPATAPLPPPPAAAKQLKDECVSVARRWQRKWGGVHRVLELGWKFVMNALGIEDDESARRREEAEHKQRMEREAEVMRLRYDTARQEWNERRDEMQECIDSVDGCIEILFPPEEEWTVQAAEDGSGGANGPIGGTAEGAVIDNAEQVEDEGGSDNEVGAVEWEEDDTQQALPHTNAHLPADTAADSTDPPPTDEDDWTEEYLRTGGSTEVSGTGDGVATGAGDEGDENEGEWNVDELVADAGLGSRAYELDINFDANLGKLETEGQPHGATHPTPENQQKPPPLTPHATECDGLLLVCRESTDIPNFARLLQTDAEELPATGHTTRRSLVADAASTAEPLTCVLTLSFSVPMMLDNQLLEWRYVVQRVKLQPPPPTTAEQNDDARRTHTLLQQRERQQTSDAMNVMLDAMTRKLQQCAQLNITAQQRSTLLTQLDNSEQAQPQPSSAQSSTQQSAASAKRPGDFFGVLKRSRQQAAKRVEKHAKKRRSVKEKLMAKPSDQHKKQKLGTQA